MSDKAEPSLVESSAPIHGTSGVRLLISWIWVGVPLAWGVWQTLIKSLPLFR